MQREDKERVVAELVERLRTSETLLVADYRGLTHAELDGVRTELLQHGARFAVVKNTLTRRAAEMAGVDALDEFLNGPTAIAFVSGGDMVAVAKTLSETARVTRRLELKGGVLQGRSIPGDAVRELATLPAPDVLRGQLLGVIVGPMTSIVGIFTAPLRDVVGVLDARIRQLEEQGGATAAPDEPEPAVEEALAEPEPPAEPEAPAEAEAPAEPEASAGAEASAETDTEPTDEPEEAEEA